MAAATSFLERLKNFLLALGVLLLGAALLYGAHHWTERYDAALADLSATLEQQAQQLATQSATAAAQLLQLEQQLQQQQLLLDAQRQQLQRLGRIGSDQWQVREAHGLSRLAQQRLQLMGDYVGAARLLEAALYALQQGEVADSAPARQLLQQDAEQISHWYQAAQPNLATAFRTMRSHYPAVFQSAQTLALESQSVAQPEGWQHWLAQLPLRFTARHQPDLSSLTPAQAAQQRDLFRVLFAQAEMAGLMQKYNDQVRVLEQMSRQVQALSLAPAEDRLALLQALEDARQQALALAQPLELQSTAALAALIAQEDGR